MFEYRHGDQAEDDKVETIQIAGVAGAVLDQKRFGDPVSQAGDPYYTGL